MSTLSYIYLYIYIYIYLLVSTVIYIWQLSYRSTNYDNITGFVFCRDWHDFKYAGMGIGRNTSQSRGSYRNLVQNQNKQFAMPTQLRNQTSCHSVATGISQRKLQIAHRNSLITPSACPGSHKNCWLHGAKRLTTSCQCMPAIRKIQSTWDSPQSFILERFLWTILMSKSKF